jgi:hypothetical protein
VADAASLYLGGGQKFAVAFEVTPESLGNDYIVVSKWGHGSAAEWLIRLHSTGDVYFLVAPTLGYASADYAHTTGGPISIGVTAKVVLQFDGTQATDAGKSRIWVNNVEKTLTFDGSQPTSFQNGGAALVAGCADAGAPVSSWFFDGRIANLGLWGRPLTANEIARLNTGGLYS